MTNVTQKDSLKQSTATGQAQVTTAIEPAQEKSTAKSAVPANGKPVANAMKLSGAPGVSNIGLPPHNPKNVSVCVTEAKPEAASEHLTEAKGGAAAQEPLATSGEVKQVGASGGDGAQAKPGHEKVPDYQQTFGQANYVKDGQDPTLLGLAKRVVDGNPDLKNSELAQHLAQGKIGAKDVKALQGELQAKGYNVGETGVDGKYGPRTHAALQRMLAGEKPDVTPGTGPTTASVPQAAQNNGTTANQTAANDPSLSSKLKTAAEHSKYSEAVHQCFRYAWDVNRQAGGKGIGEARASQDGRGKPITHLDQMAKDGTLKVGDVIYANRKPGADPTSRNLKYGPHWFVYMGNGQFADQYHNRATGGRMKTASEMQQFVKGRVIDTIYHTH